MTMEEIFKGTKEFKQEVFNKVQLELNQFGLLIYNANVKQLVDVTGHEYFSYLGQKTQMEAANQAKVDIAEAKMKGEIGSKMREGQTTQNAAKIDAETKIISTKREGEGKKEKFKVTADAKIFENKKKADVAEANAELAMKKAWWAQSSQLAEVEVAKAVAVREAKLQTEVERMNAMHRTEKLKADLLSKASVEYDIKVSVSSMHCEICVYIYIYTHVCISNCTCFSVCVCLSLLGKYFLWVFAILSGVTWCDSITMLEKNMFQEMAKINAQAVNSLQPQISVWSGVNGGDAENGGGVMKYIAGVYTMLPPLLKTVNEQTGMLPPPWLGKFTADSICN
ncbi:LOW QUALITY PROTEIN: hypothetical protein CFOL_v3_14408 [Cephalotus follicularis]|uniref:Flotillin-like n=1 Tax=Cephalotus follicularis TaxID=3775 RepID=A0A1Q3BSF5_CEPFO|nr:LOW QUALITY PROTEIN: hypothetical protein CFOL_v3_14408 [Cephalotus follicularis]